MKPLKLTMSAFGPYAGVTAIDFCEYQNGLYIITGDTGAGKSTIFDAITYVLYGEAATERRENSMLRSDFADKDTKTYVELEFLYNGEIYKINRNPRYSREGLKSDEVAKAEMIYPDGSIKSGVKEVNRAVIELLKIDRDQFTQIAMIAQGEFLKLLLAGTEDRERIFRKIFNTDFYRRFQEKLKADKREAEDEYKSIKSEIDKEMKNVIGGMDLSLYDWSRIDDFTAELELFIRNDEEKAAEIKKDEDELRKNSVKLSQKITSTQKNNDILRSLAEEKEKLAVLEAMAEQILKKREEVKRNEEMSIALIPVYDRVLSKRESVKRLNDVIDTHKNTLAECKDVVDSLKTGYILEQEKEPYSKQLLENITSLKNEFKHYDDIELLEKKYADTKSSFETAQKNVYDIRASIEDAQKVARELEEKLSHMKNADTELERAKTAQAEIVKTANKIKSIRLENDELKIAVTEYDKKTKEYLCAERECGVLQEEYTQQYNLFLREQAGIIAEELRDGEPCPVCGSTLHPCAAKKSKHAPTREELGILKDKLDLSVSGCRDISEKAGNAKKQCEIYENSIKTALTDMYIGEITEIDEVIDAVEQENIQAAVAADADVKATENTVTERNEAVNTLKTHSESVKENEERLQNFETEMNSFFAELKSCEAELNTTKAMVSCANRAEAEKKVASYENEYNELVNKLEAAKKAYEDCLNKIDKAESFIFDNDALSRKENEELSFEEQKLSEVMAKFGMENESEIDVPEDSVISKIRSEIEGYEDNVKKCRERVNVLDETAVSKELVDISVIEKEKAELDKKIEATQHLAEDLNLQLRVNSNVRSCISELSKRLDESERKYAAILELSQTANGDLPKKQRITFESYIQSSYFRSMLDEANKRFSYMTSGRFKLVKKEVSDNLKSRAGLEIDVIDNYTGRCRDVKSLSGGESFKASLCMALGLSEVIQRNAGGVKLEAMFVDEGFGVLDDESLSQAVEVLSQLSESDRMVGIISHINELKDRIDKKIVVKRGRTGSTIETIY